MASDFERLYQQTRTRLLLQTWALTGDLRGAKNSVRDAFIHAAHHWRKVAPLSDPEPWLRSHAWHAAQRRQVTRVWSRERLASPEVRATLDALGRLNPTQRKLLILNHLTGLSLPEMAREIGLTRELAEQELQLAEAQFSMRRGVPSTSTRFLLDEPRETAEQVRWPRAPLVWRAGAARRRAHTGAGIAVTVFAVIVGGNLLGGTQRIVAAVHDPATVVAAPAPAPSGPGDPPADTPKIADQAMLTLPAAKKLLPARAWHLTTDGPITVSTSDVPCRAAPAADSSLVAGLVRTFSTSPGTPMVKAYEVVEHSGTVVAAQAAYRTTLEWYAACAVPHIQLLSVNRVAGVGDESALLVLRKWTASPRTWTVAIARTGAMVASTVVTSSAVHTPGPLHVAALARQAVAGLCTQDGAGHCPGTPKLAPMALPPIGAAPGMLAVIDLPPVTGVSRPWLGTPPQTAQVNPAATSCEAADFGKPITHGTTRSFLIPGSGLPTRFGLSESVGTLQKRKARAWVNRIRQQLAGCPDRQLATKVSTLLSRQSPGKRGSDLTIWRLTTDLSNTDTVEVYMAVFRRDTAIGQLSFIPTPTHALAPGAFTALAERALDRLAAMPRP